MKQCPQPGHLFGCSPDVLDAIQRVIDCALGRNVHCILALGLLATLSLAIPVKYLRIARIQREKSSRFDLDLFEQGISHFISGVVLLFPLEAVERGLGAFCYFSAWFWWQIGDKLREIFRLARRRSPSFDNAAPLTIAHESAELECAVEGLKQLGRWSSWAVLVRQNYRLKVGRLLLASTAVYYSVSKLSGSKWLGLAVMAVTYIAVLFWVLRDGRRARRMWASESPSGMDRM